MKRARLRLFIVTLALTGTFSLGYWVSRVRAAGIPATTTLSYSGTLTDTSGTPLTGSKNVLLQLYAAVTGGSALCASTPASVTLISGTFQVPLGDDCVDVIHANPDLWIDVLIDGASIGRSKLGAVPYAVEADTAQHAASANTAAGTLATTIQTLQTSLQTLQAAVATLSCPNGYYQAGPNVCIESAATPHPATDAFMAAATCRTMQGGHVCSHSEMFQACAAVGTNGIPATYNPYGGATLGWYSDHGPLDDMYFEWNNASCADNNDGPPQPAPTLLPYRCCK
jgi:hypothetical protein